MQVCHHCGHEIVMGFGICNCKYDVNRPIICIHNMDDSGRTMHGCARCVPLTNINYKLEDIRNDCSEPKQLRTYTLTRAEMPVSKIFPNMDMTYCKLYRRLPSSSLDKNNVTAELRTETKLHGVKYHLVFLEYSYIINYYEYFYGYKEDTPTTKFEVFKWDSTKACCINTISSKNGLTLSRYVFFNKNRSVCEEEIKYTNTLLKRL